MKEHIKTLEELAGPQGLHFALHPALRAAIELMNAAEPKDEAAEREHCRASFERDMRPLSGVQPMHTEWLMRERVQARAEGVASVRAKFDQVFEANGTLVAQLAAAQADLERAQEMFVGQSTRAGLLETKLKNLRTAAERVERELGVFLDPHMARAVLGAAIEASR